MPENVKVSALTESTDEQMRDGALMLNSVIDSGSSTGFTSKKTTFSRFANYILNKFTGLSLAGESQTVKDAIDGIADELLDESGTYDEMEVGTSKQLLSESYTIDRTPYKYRRSPFTDRLSESIVGASVAFNQLVQNGNFETAGGWYIGSSVPTVSDNVASFTAASDATLALTLSRAISVTAGHKIIAFADVWCDHANQYRFRFPIISGIINTTANAWTQLAKFGEVQAGQTQIGIQCNSINGANYKWREVHIIDLTAMFGSTVADALYNMGDDGVKLFRSWYPKAYYEYSAPTLEHVSGLESHEMVGFNAFDASTAVGNSNINSSGAVISGSHTVSDFIKILPSTEYYVLNVVSSTNGRGIVVYDADKTFISVLVPNNISSATSGTVTTSKKAMYMRVMTDSPKSCNVNLSDPTRNGTYKPYEKHTYALDASLTLRGLIKYDSTKGFYADGDVYEADGTVTRKYRELVITGDTITNVSTASTGVQTAYFTLGSAYRGANNANLVASNGFRPVTSAPSEDKAVRVMTTACYIYDNTFTDLATAKTLLNTSPITLVYELETPITESAEPFEAIQITDGTEEYITDCLAPVGHESKYYANLRSKIEGLPTDFSAIICATEATNKASKNYAVGDYLIYGNTLYKVTTAIAANATLTVGTNITATTIMAEIKALQ